MGPPGDEKWPGLLGSDLTETAANHVLSRRVGTRSWSRAELVKSERNWQARISHETAPESRI
jgi:hypothetical protein